MLEKSVAIAAVVFATACIDDGVHGTQGSLPTDESADDTGMDTPADTPVAAVADRPREPDETQLPQCDLLPQDDSACAHACDEDALLEYIPEGTCASFTCPLSDGTTLVTGGCN